jgi:hypothetical protein
MFTPDFSDWPGAVNLKVPVIKDSISFNFLPLFPFPLSNSHWKLSVISPTNSVIPVPENYQSKRMK